MITQSIITRADFHKPNQKKTLPKLKQIEIATMNLWLSTGAIKETERGQENVYFVNEFGHEFFCKCL